MKKIFTLIAAAMLSVGAFAQHYEWTAAQLPSVDDAKSQGMQDYWGLGYFLPQDYTLIDNDVVKVTVPTTNSLVSTPNSKGSTKDRFATILKLGMNSSTRDGIDPVNFDDGVNDNPYVWNGKYTNTNEGVADFPYQVGMLKIEMAPNTSGGDPWTYAVTLKTNRGANAYALYVVDQTKSKMEIQVTCRNHKDYFGDDVTRFNAEQGHTYYVLSSETKGVVDFVGISIDDPSSESYELLPTEANCTDIWTADNMPYADGIAKGYNDYWAVGYCVPANTELYKSDNLSISTATNTIISKANVLKNTHAMALFANWGNLTNDGIDPVNFEDGVNDNPYVETKNYNNGGLEYVYNNGIIKVEIPAVAEGDPYVGRLIINYTGGANNRPLYVVDQTKGIMAYQDVSRMTSDGKSKTSQTAVVNVYPGRTFYILSGKGAEIYTIGFCSGASEKYATLAPTAISNATVATAAAQKVVKAIKDGKLVIVKGANTYNVAGQLVK